MAPAILSLLAASMPSAAAADAGDVSFAADLRVERGLGDREGLDLGGVAAGLEVRPAPTLALRGLALAFAPVAGDGVAAGAGGELALRLVPFPAWRVRPYVSGTAGLVLFPGPPFLAGGDAYEFALSLGGGLDVVLSPRWTLSAGVHGAHLSNGQGLGPHNPAYDALGATVGVAWSFAPSPGTPPAAWPEPTATRGRGPGLEVEGGVGRAGDALLLPGRLRVTQALAGALVVVDLEGGALAGLPYGEAGVGVVRTGAVVTAGAHAGWRRFAGADVLVLAVQPEVHLAPAMSLVALAHHERSAAFGEAWRASAGGRFHPLADLRFEVGAGCDLTAPSLGEAADPWLGVEWRIPWPREPWQVSVYAEHHVSGADLAGARVAWGMGPTLRDASRGAGWRRIR